MRTRGKILSFLCLLSISFSTFAIDGRCPEVDFLNQHPEFSENDSFNVEFLGAVQITHFGPEPYYGRWVAAGLTNLEGGKFVCIYTSAVSLTLITTVSNHWKPIESALFKSLDRCTVSIERCQAFHP